MDWEEYRRPDETLDILRAWRTEKKPTYKDEKVGRNFLVTVERYYKISSRQTAAIALAIADTLVLMSKRDIADTLVLISKRERDES
jgi:alkanesulfonate monooxygenase SsuD/methylene tetrahydromethanopterin reductase-like flavin-dependent oxidoreductase (luciferase family)